jgi:hypothetical protein
MRRTTYTVSDSISRIVRLVDAGSWRTSRVSAYRIISECQELTDGDSVSLLTHAERSWLTGSIVWVSESLEDAARGEGIYMD